MIGEQAMTSLGTSRRNCARGLRAPFLWFFHAMRVSTSFISSAVDAVLLAVRGRQQLNSAGAVSSAAVPSDGGGASTSPEKPPSFSFSTPMAMAMSMAPDATA